MSAACGADLRGAIRAGVTRGPGLSGLGAVLALSLALSLAGGPARASVDCPSARDGRPLGTVSVFDGPPAEMADLRPEASGQIDVWAGLNLTGRPAFLVCRYGGLSGETSLRLPDGTATCRGVRRPDNRGYASVQCK